MKELIDSIGQVATGKYICKPHKIKSRSVKLNQAISTLTDKLSGQFPDLPNLKWVALRLLEGDNTIIEAIRTGELGSLKTGVKVMQDQ